ncbi:MAG: DUF5666 domain-containing protein [Candidatus Dormibacteria bacterium]
MTKTTRSNQAARLLAIGGLAVGAGFGASTVLAATASPTSSPSPTTNTQAPGPRGDPGGPGGKHGHGGGGTITSISGSSLTLRTERGTQTVTSASTTTYMKEQQVIHFSDLRVGDVVHVQGTPSSGSTPGTGTIAATAVNVAEPSLGGRVQSVSGDTYTLVGKDGALLTVTVTGSTRYYSAGQSSTRSAITTGSHVHAEGKQDSLTHLTADDLVLDPAPPAAG